jgi:hypothetical protein
MKEHTKLPKRIERYPTPIRHGVLALVNRNFLARRPARLLSALRQNRGVV